MRMSGQAGFLNLFAGYIQLVTSFKLILTDVDINTETTIPIPSSYFPRIMNF
jgi:hypothetical protein